jgi:hypothetical protein
LKAILRALNAEENMPDQDRAEWTKVVADFETSALSQREFAKERMLSLSNLRYWINRLRNESRPLVTEPTERSVNKAERRPSKKGLILKPVRVVGSAPKARQGKDGSVLPEVVESPGFSGHPGSGICERLRTAQG